MTSHNGQPPNTPAPTHVPVAVSIPDGNDRDEDKGLQIKPLQIWAAFRRRWLLSFFLGALVAVPVAYMAWERVPAPFVAEAEIQILSSRPRVQFDLQEDRTSFDVFKSTQMRDVIHPDTLNLALEEGNIAQLSPLNEIKQTMDPVDWLRRNVKVISRDKEFFTISLEGEFPVEQAKIVNAVQKAYFDRSLDRSSLSAGSRSVLLQTQLDELNVSIAAKQDQISNLAKIGNAANSSQRDIVRESKLALIGELQKDIVGIERELIGLQSQLKFLTTPQDENADGSENLLGEKELQTLIELDDRYKVANLNVKRLERNVARYKEVFSTPDHPTMKTLQSNLNDAVVGRAELETQLKEFYIAETRKQRELSSEQSKLTLEENIANLTRFRDDLQAKMGTLEIENQNIGNSSREIETIEEELHEEKDLARNIRDEINKIEIEKEAGERILLSYSAKVPEQREMKKKYMLTAGGGIASFGLIVVLITLLELRYMKIDSLGHLESEFKFPILGIIPNLPARMVSQSDTSGKSAFYMHAFTESIDTTRTMLLNHQRKAPLQVIMVTSAQGGEGKSTLSCHLAISFARAGRKTLLIDGDMRSPRVHEVFGVADFPGLCEVLREETPLGKCVIKGPISGLSILPAGELDGETLRLLASERIASLSAELKQNYDIIVIDSAPILPVNDSLLILQHVDGVVMSIRKDVSRVAKVTAALNKIEMLGGKLLGGVVIGIDGDDYGYRSKYLRGYRREITRDERELSEASV